MEAEEDDAAKDAEPDPDSPNFRDKPLPSRALVIAGGPIANYITAIALFFVAFTVFGPKGPPEALVISGFAENSPAEAAGVLEGDEVIKVGTNHH